MVENKEEIEINEDFKKSLNIMENTNDSVLITGKAGTGKSTLLNYFKEHTKKNIVVCAPTGIAALNVRGQTIHSLFRFPIGILVESNIKRVPNNSFYKTIDTILIEEISMVRADLFDAIDIFMRLNGKDPSKPFGGVQVILFGDLYQLPPVVKNDERNIINQIYESPWFFDSNIMNDLYFDLEIIVLTKVYRQTEAKFIEFLDKVRFGNIQESDLGYINSRINNSPSDNYVTLTPTNFVANSINQNKLLSLPGKTFTYKSEIEGDFKLGLSNLPTETELKLKAGAKIIFVKNDPQHRWVNGTLGIVEECLDDCVKVKINNNPIPIIVFPDYWEQIKYVFDKSSKRIIAEVVGKFTQIPLKLAWALTIHKSQSQTLERVHINLSSGVWEFGHTYVALSRCRTHEGITLDKNICVGDIKVDYRVTDFLNKNI